MTFRHAKNCGRLSCLGLAASLVFTAPAFSQPEFDETIAKATADQVAKKLGSLRDGFTLNEEVVLVPLETRAHKRVRETLRIDGMRRVKPIRALPRLKRERSYDQVAMNDVRIVYVGTIIEQ